MEARNKRRLRKEILFQPLKWRQAKKRRFEQGVVMANEQSGESMFTWPLKRRGVGESKVQDGRDGELKVGKQDWDRDRS